MADINEHLYEKAANEIHNSVTKPGLWAKAFSDSNGDLEKTKALYIRLRVEQLNQPEDQTNIEGIGSIVTDPAGEILLVMPRLSVIFQTQSGPAPSFSHYFPPEAGHMYADVPIDMVLTENRLMFFPGIRDDRLKQTAVIAGGLVAGAFGAHLFSELMEKLATHKDKAYDALFLDKATQSGEFPFLDRKDLVCEICELRTSWDMFGGTKNANVIFIGDLHYQSKVTKGLAWITFVGTSAKNIPSKKVFEQAGIKMSLLDRKFEKWMDVYEYVQGRHHSPS